PRVVRVECGPGAVGATVRVVLAAEPVVGEADVRGAALGAGPAVDAVAAAGQQVAGDQVVPLGAEILVEGDSGRLDELVEDGVVLDGHAAAAVRGDADVVRQARNLRHVVDVGVLHQTGPGGNPGRAAVDVHPQDVRCGVTDVQHAGDVLRGAGRGGQLGVLDGEVGRAGPDDHHPV